MKKIFEGCSKYNKSEFEFALAKTAAKVLKSSKEIL